MGGVEEGGGHDGGGGDFVSIFSFLCVPTDVIKVSTDRSSIHPTWHW